ncbi:hypothetical protein [Luteibacter yeojuensis]
MSAQEPGRARARRRPASLGLVLLACHVPIATATDALTEGHVDGSLRVYDYRRAYSDPHTPDASAFAMAWLFNAQSREFGAGFSAGASLVTANALGTRPSATRRLDATLMGRENALTALSQAYVQFRNDAWTVRIGDQYIDTPWLGTSDSRVLPASYRAMTLEARPAEGWVVRLIRSYDWKSRTSDRFHPDNLYYPTDYDGDPVYGGNGALPVNARAFGGTWSAGVAYASGPFKGEAWFYDFLRFARMTYLEGTWTFQSRGEWTPFLAGQLVEEWSGGDNTLVDTKTRVVGVAGTRVRSEVPGVDMGMRIRDTIVDLAWNRVLRQASGTIGGGALISPYTATYATDPLYTTSMLRGLVEQGPGDAWKLKAKQAFLAGRLQIVTAYTRYRTLYRGDSHDIYVDVIYRLDGRWQGLQLRNRWERSSGAANNLNPGNRPFSFDRVMISYAF